MTFNEVFLAFGGLLVASLAVKAGACVCYVGQEPNSIKGEPPLKLLPDQNPCECTEFRPGGVNTKQQAKPYEVTFGNDGYPEGWTEMDCIHETQTVYTTTSPCDDTHSLQSNQGLSIPPFGEPFQSYPVRLEFTLQSSTNDEVAINSFNIENVFLCTFELNGFSDKMYFKKDGVTEEKEDFQDAFDGSTHYWVTINQYQIEFGRLGEAKTLEYQSLNHKISRVSIKTLYGTTVVFHGTCPAEVGLFTST